MSISSGGEKFISNVVLHPLEKKVFATNLGSMLSFNLLITNT